LNLGGVAAPILLLYPPDHQPEASGTWLEKLLPIDWLGIVLNAAMYATFVLSLTFAGGPGAWNDAGTITMLFGGDK
jgi:hypothetical protein